MKKIMTEKHRYIAYVLNVDLGYHQRDIAELMGINQSTISSAIVKVKKTEKDVEYYDRLKEARNELERQGFKDDKIYLYPTPQLIERMNRNRKKAKKDEDLND